MAGRIVSRIPCPGAYTNDAQKLGEELGRDVSKPSAIDKSGAGRGKESGAKAKVPFQYSTVWRRPKSTGWAFMVKVI